MAANIPPGGKDISRKNMEAQLRFSKTVSEAERLNFAPRVERKPNSDLETWRPGRDGVRIDPPSL